jgi:ABC-type transport system involved in multi-copper enzyme maturation permease subunit
MMDEQNNFLQTSVAGRGPRDPVRVQTWLIAKKEIVANVSNYKIPVVSAIMLLMLVASAHLLTRDYRLRLDNWAINQASQRDSVVGGIVKYELSDGGFTYSAGIGHGPPIQQPRSLSALVNGVDLEVDRAVSVSQRIVFGTRQDDLGTKSLFDIPDTSFVIKLMVSLFALMFSLDIVTREKESGTLKAMLGQPIGRRGLILYKSLGAWISLIVSFAIAYFGEIFYLYFSQGLLRDWRDLARALLIFGLGALYGTVFLHLGIFISTITAQTKIAVATALLAWAAIVLVLPNVAALTAKLFSPTLSYNQFNARLFEARQQLLRADPQLNPERFPLSELPASKPAMFRIFDLERQLTDSYLASKEAQLRRAQLFAALSPASALAFGSSDLAGTGVSAYRSYLEFFRSERDTIVDALKRRLDLPFQEGTRLVQGAREAVAGGRRPAVSLGSSLRAAAISIISLLAWAVVFGWMAYWRFERYDVR